MPFIDWTKKYFRIELTEAVLYWVIAITMMILFPLGIGFIWGAFKGEFGVSINTASYLGSFIVYTLFMFATLLVPLFLIYKLIILKKGENVAELKNVKWYHIFANGSWIFDPENGFLWWVSEKLGFKDKRNLMRWSKSIFRMVMLGLIIFGIILTMRVAFPKQMAIFGFSDVPKITLQQVTPVSEIAFTTEPASHSETGTLLFVFILIQGFWAYIVAKMKFIKPENKMAIYWLISLLFTAIFMFFLWGGMHKIVYFDSDKNLLSTGVFGFIGALLTLLFGTWILWYILHFENNFFQGLTSVVTAKEDIIFLVGFVIIPLLIIGWVAFEYYLYKRKKKIGEDTYFNG